MTRFQGWRMATRILFLVVLAMITTACVDLDALQVWNPQDDEEVDDTIVFALPGPLFFMEEASHFLKGVEMAVAEVNETGLLGRHVDTIVADDQGSFVEGTNLAQSFVNDPRIAGVIGHWHSHVTLPASSIYEEGNKLLLSPVVSNVALTQQGHRLVFQNIPGDDEIGRQMALFATEQGYARVVLLYEDSPYGRGLANAFEDAAENQDVQLVDRRHRFVDQLDMARAVRLWRAMEYEAVFVAYGMPRGGDLISRLNRAGVDVPILGGDGLDFDFIETLGPDAEGVFLATIFHPGEDRPQLRSFRERFTEHYRHEPDVWAIQGYDSVKLLAHAISVAGTTDPHTVAEVLRGLDGWDGVLSRFSFNDRGQAEGFSVYQQTVQDGVFVFVH